LKLVVANLLMPGCALRASATATNEWHCDAIPDFPFDHSVANRCHHASQFMTGHVRRLNIRVMSDPAMPVATTNSRSHDLDDYAMGFRSWIRDIF
jgi:hypothetical protein